MIPEAAHVLAQLHQLQPDIRHLATLSVLTVPGGYLDSLQNSARAHGIGLHNEQLDDVADLPGRLRQLARIGIDALWLPPDPLLINASTFAVLKEFSRANRVPLYVPTAGFVEAGAVAAVAPSFQQIGIVAALAARDLLKGRALPSEIFPMNSETTVNVGAAHRAGLTDEFVRRVADRLIEAVE